MKQVFSFLKKLRFPFLKKSGKHHQHHSGKPKQKTGSTIDGRDISQREADFKKIPLTANLEQNLRLLQQICGNSYDLSIKHCLIGPEEVWAAFIFLDGMVNKAAVEKLLRTVKLDIFKTRIEGVGKKKIYETVKKKLLTSEQREARDMEELYEGISFGETALLFDGTAKALLAETRGWEMRAVTEPESESAIRGPREGFVENIRVNTSLIRRRIRSPNLWIENLKLGSLTGTEVAYAYIKGLAGEEILGELRARLERIDIDGVLESSYIEEYIRDAPFSVFPTLLRTERPDLVAAAILEGRVAVFTNGTPFVLILPGDLLMMLQAPDDYFEVWPIGSFIRLLRIFAFLIAIFLPSIYVAVLSFHQELLPTALLLTIQFTREGIPFPLVAEMLIMEVTFEMLREAGVRLPRAIGSAISIVGALILGDAAIRAGIVSPGVVIIVAFTAIASFTSPIFSLAIAGRLLRFFMIILGAFLGLLGIQFGFLVLLVHLVSLRSFGYPYFAPLGPLIWEDLKDALARGFWWQMKQRPKLLGFREPQRQRGGQMPHPPREDDPHPKNGRKGK